MNLVDIGEGAVVLMVHGLSGSWQNWLENIPYFARDHRVIAVDLPGFGESEMPAKDISISRYADTVDALLDALEIDRPVRLIGNSMGGFIGAELAIRYPQRVERLVLVAAAGLSVENIRTKRQKGLRHRAENIAFFNIGWLASRSPAVVRRAAAALGGHAARRRVSRPAAARADATSRSRARARTASPARSRRCATTRSASGCPRSSARRSSSGATRTGSSRSRTRRSSRS